MGRTGAKPSLIALVLLTGVGPFATDTYLAALPEVREQLSTSDTIAQLTVTAFLAGLAVGQLVLGPVSDALGRRRLLVLGAAAFLVTSVACALAPSGLVLVGLRLVQGLVAGGGVAVGRAVVSDRWTGPDAARMFGTLAAITLLGPVVAPAVGGLILLVGGWREIFVFLALLGAAMLVAVLRGIPETLEPARRQPAGVRQLFVRSGDLLRDARFRGPVVVQCLATGGFFVYIGGSSFVLQTQLGMGQGLYTLVFATNAAAMSAASVVFRAQVVRRGAARLRAVGLLASASAAVLLVVVAALGGDDPSLAGVWVLLAVAVAGMGLVIPSTTVLAQEAGRRSAGTAASLSGGLSFLAGAAATPLTGVLGQQSVLAMGSMMAALLVGAVVASRVTAV